MKCLSVWEPWATMLVLGEKACETRSWPAPDSAIGHVVAIHAGKSDQGLRVLASQPALAGIVWTAFTRHGLTRPDPFSPGCIVGVARLVRSEQINAGLLGQTTITEVLLGDWTIGRFAWRMADPRPLATPIPLRGQQGLFELPAPVLAALRAQLPGLVTP